MQKNINQIPSPFQNGEIDIKNEDRSIILETTRGCPNNCRFCTQGIDPIREFSLKRVENDLSIILSNGCKRLAIIDGTFNYNNERAKYILKFIADFPKHPNFNLGLELRADIIDIELIEYLKRASLCVLEIGLQSSDIEIQEISRCQKKLKKLHETTKLAMQYDIPISIQTIFGLPEDTLDKYKETLDYAISTNPAWINHSQLMINPGTYFFNNATKFKLYYDSNTFHINKTSTMSQSDIEECYRIGQNLELYNTRLMDKTLYWLSNYLHISYTKILQSISYCVTPEDVIRWIEVLSVFPRIPYERFISNDQKMYLLEKELFSLFNGFQNKNELEKITHNLLMYDYYKNGINKGNKYQKFSILFDYDITKIVNGDTILKREKTLICFTHENKAVNTAIAGVICKPATAVACVSIKI